MNATMIKGERSKLLAVAVVIAMVACALVAFMPATNAVDDPEITADYGMTDADAVTVYYGADDAIGTPMSLSDALKGEANAEGVAMTKIVLKPGIYNVNASGASGFIIDVDDIVITGSTDAENPTIIWMSEVTNAGGYGGQNLVTILGDNITFENFTLYSMLGTGKGNPNTEPTTWKSLEIYGNNAEVRNIILEANPQQHGNTQDSTCDGFILIQSNDTEESKCTLDNITMNNGFINLGYDDDTNIVMNNVTFDAIDNYGSGISYNTNNDETPGELNSIIDATGVVINLLSDKVAAESAINNAPEGTTINVKADITLDREVIVPKDVKINVDSDKKITVASTASFDTSAGTINGEDAIVNNGLVITGTDSEIAEVGSWDALKAVLKDAEYNGVSKVYLTADVATPVEAATGEGFSATHKVTLYLNGNNLDVMGRSNLSNITIDVDADSKLTLGPSAVLLFVSDTEDDRSIVTYSGSEFVKMTGAKMYYGDDSGNTLLYPYLNDGVIGYIQNKDGNMVHYTIFHAVASNGAQVQFGVASSPVYNGENQAGPTKNASVASFDNNYPGVSNPSYYLHNDATIDENSEDSIIREYGVCKDVGEHQLHVTFEIGSENQQAVSIDTDITITMSPANPIAGFDVEDEWSYGENAVYTITYSDCEKIDIGSYVQKVGAGNIIFTVTTATEKITFDYDDLVEGALNDLGKGQYSISVTFPAKDGNYLPVTITDKFEVTAAQFDIEFGVVENTDGLFWGTDPDRYMDYETYKVADNGDKVSVSGGIYWFSNVNAGIENSIFPDDEAKGYYLLLNIVNPNQFDVQVTFGSTTKTVANENSEDNTLQWIQYIGDDLQEFRAPENVITLTPVGTTDYETQTVTLDVSDLYRPAEAGYEADRTDAYNAINEYFGWNGGTGIAQSGIADRTMWLVFDDQGTTGLLTGKLWYTDGDSCDLIDEAEISNDTAATGERIWYFSFGETEPAGISEYYRGGYFILQVMDSDGNVIANTTASAEIDDISGYGYNADAETVTEQMIAAGISPDILEDDVSPETMWMAWYTAEEIDGKVTATLTYNGKEIHDETSDAWNKVGYHAWYFSFADGIKDSIDYDPLPGTYVMTIAVDGAEEPLYTATVYIAGDYDSGYLEDAGEAYTKLHDDLGFTTVVADEVADLTMWLAWTNAEGFDGEVTATLTLPNGQTFVEKDSTKWNTIGNHVWYFSLADGEQVDKYITAAGGTYEFQYGTYHMLIEANGQEYTAEFTIYDPSKYYVTINEWDTSYDDENTIYDLEFDVKLTDEYRLPAGNFPGKTVQYWQLYVATDVDGEYTYVRDYQPGGAIIFDQMGLDEDVHFLEFRAKYVTGSGDSGNVDPEADVQLIGGAFFADASQAKLAMVSLGSTYTGYVDANTIFVVYAQNGYSDAAMTLQVFYGGEPLLKSPETMISADGIRTALFSFENQLKDKLQAGDYTFVLYADSVQVADFIVSIAPSDIPAEPEDPETPVDPVYRTEYEVSAEIVDGKLQITVRSDETGAEFINLDGTFYYTYEAYDSAWRAVDLGIADKDLISKTITANGKVCTETKLVDISGLEAGLHINVQLMVATNGVQFLLDEFNFTVGTIETAGVEADAADVIEAVGTASGIALDPENVADETVYAVFEADAGTYTCSLSNADGEQVYAEELTFVKDGAHVWYFSLIETEPSWNPEYPGIIDAFEEGEIVDGEYIVTVVDAENNTIFTGSIELTA